MISQKNPNMPKSRILLKINKTIMKTFIRKTISAICFLVLCFSLSAQTSLTVDVKEPGTLETLIGESKYTLQELKLKGEMNIDDFDIIHQCASRGVLATVDFSEVKLPNNEIPDKAFFETKSGVAWSLALKTVILPKTLNRIGKYAFAVCGSMESIQMPETLSVLEESAFVECRGLKEITIPLGCSEIKQRTFNDCMSLESVRLPEGLKTIGYSAFYCCYKLASINFPESLETIGDLAFALNALETVIIPQNVTDIGIAAFFNCPNLRTVELSGNMKELKPDVFKFLDNITEINIPEGIEKIGDEVFLWDFELVKVSLPSSLTYIGKGAFGNCGFETITLPENLSFIDAAAFKDCGKLKTLYSMNSTPPELGARVSLHWATPFEGVDKNVCVLYVPKGAKENYQNAEEWQDFVQIIETEQFPMNIIAERIESDLRIQVYGENDCIVVKSGDCGIPIFIYDMQGRVVRHGITREDATVFAVPCGLYIVKVGSKSYKISF